MKKNILGAFGYSSKKNPVDHTFSCVHMKPVPNARFNYKNRLQSLLTWNVWMNDAIPYNKKKERMNFCLSEIAKHNSDVIFLQEVNVDFFMVLRIYFKDTHIFCPDIDIEKYMAEKKIEFISPNINPDSFTLSMSKLQLHDGYYLSMAAEHNCSGVAIETSDYFLINIYLHAGSLYSPGVTPEIAEKYKSYRLKEIDFIDQFEKKYNKNKKHVILGGDFNIDFNDRVNFPEVNVINELKYCDLCTNIDYTEDTNINLMRWNIKQCDKQVKCDNILSNKEMVVSRCRLIGTEPVFTTNVSEIDDKMSSLYKHFESAHLSKDKLKLINGKLPWFCSDHFGVNIEFK